MKKLIVLCLVILILSSCVSEETLSTTVETNQSSSISPTTLITRLPPTAVFSPTPSIAPTRIPTLTRTPTPLPENDPGLLVTLGDDLGSSGGIPVFSPDGNLIALAAISQIRFWDTHTYELVMSIDNPYSSDCNIKDAAFSENGDYLAVSINDCWKDPDPLGHLLIWDINSRTLLHDWDQENAYMVDSRQGEFSNSVYTMTFLPNSTRIAYATGNSIAIRDVEDNESDPEYLELGDEMYATEISVRDDGQYLFVLMEWNKTLDYPSGYRREYRLQSWHLDPNYLNLTRGYPEDRPGNKLLMLHGDNLLRFDYINRTIEVRNLTTDTLSYFPLPITSARSIYFNSDLSLMIVSPWVIGSSDEKVIDLWNTDTWVKLYSFSPVLYYCCQYSINEITFSPDNTILAIATTDDQVILWNINSIVNPNSGP